MSGVAEILERLKAASEGSRELDWLLADLTGHPSFEKRFENIWPPFGERSKLDLAVPAYTTSLDAALALAERVLPGWGFFLRKDKDGCNCGPVYPEASFVTPGCGTSPTPALALCIAILRARQAAEAVRQDDGGR